MGKIGQNGDPIVDLLNTGEKEQGANGVTIKGNFTASDFGGSMEGKSLSDLQSAMASNQTFVNIRTSEHPDGELAGHIYSKGSTTGAEDSETSSAQNELASKEGNSEDSADNVPGEDEDQ